MKIRVEADVKISSQGDVVLKQVTIAKTILMNFGSFFVSLLFLGLDSHVICLKSREPPFTNLPDAKAIQQVLGSWSEITTGWSEICKLSFDDKTQN